MDPRMARSKLASANTIVGDLPPSSRETFLRFPAASRMISRPVDVSPVNATMSTSGWRASSAPTGSPGPVTMFTIPLGISGMPSRIFASSTVDPAV